jgi:UDPglucose--hexose-1-phosphate uridylyltransferase
VLRQDFITGDWVIVSSARFGRPNDFQVVPLVVAGPDQCPFCEGHEDQTPPEVQAWRAPGVSPDSPGWTVRAVPNKFPALSHDEGVHEVIIETPHHERRLADMEGEGIAAVLAMYRDRLLAARGDPRRRYAVIFKNQGYQAGATLQHTHSQLVALPLVPQSAGALVGGASRHHGATGRCAFCDLVAEEARHGERVVEESHGFVAVVPYASRFPFETWILPRRHDARYEDAPDVSRDEAGRMLASVLGRIDRTLQRPPFNFVLHTAPFVPEAVAWFHWHFVVIPRVTMAGGLEWGTGMFINPTAPEDAAELLRAAQG